MQRFFFLVALADVHRLVFSWEVIINGVVIPAWTSVVGAVMGIPRVKTAIHGRFSHSLPVVSAELERLHWLQTNA